MGNLSEILHSALTNRMLMYDAGKGEIKEVVRELYKNLFRELEILEIAKEKCAVLTRKIPEYHLIQKTAKWGD